MIPDREKVQQGLECCYNNNCGACPYSAIKKCQHKLHSDALALLKEHEPKKTAKEWKVAGTFDDFSQCPECGNMWTMLSTIEWAYCPVCGCRILSVPEPPKEEDDG